MPTTLNFRRLSDVPNWRTEAPAPAASVAGNCLVSDGRSDNTRHPFIYLYRSVTALDAFNPITSEWLTLGITMAGSMAAGATAVFNPSQGPRGNLSSGNTTTTLNTQTGFGGTTIPLNALANRGDGTGYRIRVIGQTAGGSGKVEERWIVGNTQGATPSITLDSPLSFTPQLNDPFEILSGRIYLLSAGTTAANFWRFYDIATNTMNATTLATANLPATIGTDSALVALSEQHTPFNRSASTGFVSGGATADGKDCILATATGSTSITGSGMPSTIVADEYRNFQVRIVEDISTPTAVNQRRRISTHTAGANAVFTVSSAFSPTPSSNAKFVIENDDDKIILRSSGTTVLYNYNITANTWDTTTWTGTIGTNGAGSCATQAYGITKDPAVGGARHSQIFWIRGGANSNIDTLDIAGSATGTWTNGAPYGNSPQSFTTGTSGVYCPSVQEGRYFYVNQSGTNRFLRFDVRNRAFEPAPYLKFPQGTAIVGNKLGIGTFFDGTTALTAVYHVTNSQSQALSVLVQE